MLLCTHQSTNRIYCQESEIFLCKFVPYLYNCISIFQDICKKRSLTRLFRGIISRFNQYYKAPYPILSVQDCKHDLIGCIWVEQYLTKHVWTQMRRGVCTTPTREWIRNSWTRRIRIILRRKVSDYFYLHISSESNSIFVAAKVTKHLSYPVTKQEKKVMGERFREEINWVNGVFGI